MVLPLNGCFQGKFLVSFVVIRVRRDVYKILKIGKDKLGGRAAWISKFPMSSDDVAMGPVSIDHLMLVEKNRGKTGALNFYKLFYQGYFIHQ